MKMIQQYILVLLYEKFKREKSITTSAAYPALLFHPTYSTLASEDVLEKFQHSVSAEPPHPDGLPLPCEIIDLIFSRLSLLNLDAARSTCRTWRSYIMNSSFILRTALSSGSAIDVDRQTAHSSLSSLRLLGRQLDLEVKAMLKPDSVKGLKSAASWRLQFRRIDLDFRGSNSSNPGNSESDSRTWQELLSACYCTEDNLIVLLVRNSAWRASTVVSIHKLEVYCLLETGRPIHVTSIPYLRGGARVEYARTCDDILSPGSEVKKCLEIRVDEDVVQVRYWARDAFEKGESPFYLEYELTPIPSSKSEESDLKSQNSGDTLNIMLRSLREYKGLDEQDKSLGVCEPLLCSMVDQFHLLGYAVLRTTGSGDIFVVQFYPIFPSDTPSLIKSIRPSLIKSIKIIDPPTQTSTFRNIALTVLNVDPSTKQDLLHPTTPAPIRIAVTWQSRDTDRQELYVYDVDIKTKLYGDNKVRPEHLRGKRVTALDFNMGGVHAKSPLRSQLSPQEARGGLVVVAKNADDLRSVRREVLVWGSHNANHTSIRFSQYDLTFSEKEHFKIIRCHYLNTELHSDLYTPCACLLHDYGYRIVIPSVPVPVAPAPRMRSLIEQTFGRSVQETSVTPNPGSVSVYNSRQREAALNRAREGMEELIRYFMQHGMEDEELLNSWNNAPWSEYGRIPLPNGWRDLREKGPKVEKRALND